jgi:hypothetical protein
MTGKRQFGIFALLQVLDLVTTVVGLHHKGFTEGNWVVRLLMQYLGLYGGLLAAKGMAVLLAWFGRNHLFLANWAYAVVVLWNCLNLWFVLR